MKRHKILLFAAISICAGALSTSARSDRLEEIIATSATRARHSAVAQGTIVSYTWTHSGAPSEEEAKRLAVVNCEKNVKGGCIIIAVNRKFNGREKRAFSTPASITVFDHVSGSKQSMRGTLKRTNSYADTGQFTLQTTAGKVLCSGSLSFQGKSWLGWYQFAASGKCFNQTADRSVIGDQKKFRMDYGGSYLEVELEF